MEKLSIVILHHQGKEILKQCLDPLLPVVNKAPKAKLKIEILIVDNNSKDDSKNYLKELKNRSSRREYKGLKVIFNRKNLGFAGGNNVGIRYALRKGADYVMILNNDVIVKDAFWQPLISFLRGNQKVGIVGPKIYFAPGYEFHKARYGKKDKGKVIWFAGGQINWQDVYAFHRGVDEIDQGQYDQPIATDFVSGCCLLARREVWQKVGLLDDRYFLYYEDSDFCLRAKRKRWQIFYVPQSNIWHLNASSSGCGGSLQDYFITRNRLLFGMRWASFRTKLALIRESLRIIFCGRKWQIFGVRDFYLGRLGRGSWQ